MKIITLTGLLALASLTGCTTTDSEHGGEVCVPAAAGGNRPGKIAINTVCPIMQSDAADGTVTVTHQGKVIALCCAGCVTKFNKMDEAAKNKVLAAAMTHAK